MTRHTAGPTPHVREMVRITPRRAAIAGLVTGALAVSLLAANSVSSPQPDQAQAATRASGVVSASSTVKFHTTGNYVRNGSFGQGTSGWKSQKHTRFLIITNANGSHRAKIINRKATRSVALNDRVNSVRRTKKGTTYVAQAFVRADEPNTSVSLRLTEYDGRSFKGEDRATVFLRDTAWHKLNVDYVARTSGATIDVNVIGGELPRGRAIYADRISLVSVTPVTTDSSNDAPSRDRSTPPTGWRLVWSDEFNGSSVNSSKWRVRNNAWSSYELSVLTNRPKNVSVDTGALRITAHRERYTAYSETRDYTSGYLDTIGKASWTYGRFEMRAKLPTAQGTSKGMWPAFWLRPNDGGDGEIDIMEAVGQAGSDNRISQTLWYDYHNTKPHQAHEDRLATGTSSGSYHVYAVEWEKTAIRWYIDGRLTFTRDVQNTPWVTAKQFAKPYNIRLNLQVGGSWPGTPDASTAFPQTYSVDYVRVYQR